MNSSHRRRIECQIRSEAEATANETDFPEGSKGGLALADLRASIAKSQANAVSRELSINALQQSTIARKEARATVRTSSRIICDTARTIALDHAEIKGIFVFKGASVDDRTLLATAQALATAARRFKSLFAEYDLHDDFFSEYDAQINNLELQLNRQAANKRERISANTSLENDIREGDRALARLRTAARNKYRNNPAKLAAWESASRLERPARSKRSNGDKQEEDDETPTPKSET